MSWPTTYTTHVINATSLCLSVFEISDFLLTVSTLPFRFVHCFFYLIVLIYASKIQRWISQSFCPYLHLSASGSVDPSAPLCFHRLFDLPVCLYIFYRCPAIYLPSFLCLVIYLSVDPICSYLIVCLTAVYLILIHISYSKSTSYSI